MIKENEIRAELAKHLAGNQSLDSFEDWLVQQSWNMHRDSDRPAQSLASKIELLLAEYSSGHIDEDALYQELRPLATLSFGTPSSNVVISESSGRSTMFREPLVFSEREVRDAETYKRFREWNGRRLARPDSESAIHR
jgi:hypothetical protein